MKKIFFLVASLFVCAMSNAQTTYYWSGGQKIWLDTDSTLKIVRSAGADLQSVSTLINPPNNHINLE